MSYAKLRMGVSTTPQVVIGKDGWLFNVSHVHDFQGLSELARVLRTGGRMLLLTTEDNFSGAWTSRFWYCRT